MTAVVEKLVEKWDYFVPASTTRNGGNQVRIEYPASKAKKFPQKQRRFPLPRGSLEKPRQTQTADRSTGRQIGVFGFRTTHIQM